MWRLVIRFLAASVSVLALLEATTLHFVRAVMN